MNKIIIPLFLALLTSCSPIDSSSFASEQISSTYINENSSESESSENQITSQESQINETTNSSNYTEDYYMTFTIGEKALKVELVDNTATRELMTKLEESDITLIIDDYGGFEKVGSLPFSLPRNDTRITTAPGDVILYQGNSLVIFYGSNTWSYTRLGRVVYSSLEELEEFLGAGTGEVELTISR